MTALRKIRFTPEEYLALEIPAEYKSQYVGGEIFAMAGAEPWHVRVTTNIIVSLAGQFRGRPCEVYNSDMRIYSEAGEMYTYPDVSALCGQPRFQTDKKPQSLLNPQVIIEVLSPSTQGFDRGDKFFRYRQIVSLVDYLLVESERMGVEHHCRQPNGTWKMYEYDQLRHVVKPAGIEAELPLSAIYERVSFPA